MDDYKTILIAIVGGVIPVLLWLWFWLREDREDPEPKGLLLITFLLGAIVVNVVLPLEKLADRLIVNHIYLITAWAAIEEIFKYFAAAAVALRSKFADEPIDYPIYMMTAALGFAAFENVLFLLNPSIAGQTILGFLTGNLRFLGATLLHVIASSIIGIAMGLAFYQKRLKWLYFLVGLILAIGLHTLFNFFIMKAEGNNFLITFAFVWVVAIIIILLFEKLRRMCPYHYPQNIPTKQT
jgi:RsiW-degrading membrane proteinase PrsW (M82 family)